LDYKKALLVGGLEVPTRVFTIDLTSGLRKPFKTYLLADPTGLFDIAPPNYSRDLKS
jgi:hypothetical protein